MLIFTGHGDDKTGTLTINKTEILNMRILNKAVKVAIAESKQI